jgi:SAM-dependent methyltransferase
MKAVTVFKSFLLSFPQKVECNICGWKGRHFLSDSWMSHINCPNCNSSIRQRLFFAALQNIKELSFGKLINNKKILHFAPEDSIKSILMEKGEYTSADFLRDDCDLKIDISNMPEIKSESFDIVLAFDVLEHVPNYKKALEEIRRILTPKGFGIFTVPQKDNLSVTFEDPNIITPEDRTKYFGQEDHLRIFGNDFPLILSNKGFDVISVNETFFTEEKVKKHVLFPPLLSSNPLATNYRKVFFCQKTT